jgi:predicted secreted protein
MAQTIASMFAIYFVLWWTVLFAVLPFGIRNPGESGQKVSTGTDPGAPVMPRMARKLLWTTIVSTIVFAIGMGCFWAGYLNIDRLSRLMGFPF